MPNLHTPAPAARPLPQPFAAVITFRAWLCSPRLYYSDKTLETIKIHNREPAKWDTATQAGALCCH